MDSNEANAANWRNGTPIQQTVIAGLLDGEGAGTLRPAKRNLAGLTVIFHCEFPKVRAPNGGHVRLPCSCKVNAEKAAVDHVA